MQYSIAGSPVGIGVCGVRANWVCLSPSFSSSSLSQLQKTALIFAVHPAGSRDEDEVPARGREIAQYPTCAPSEEEAGPPRPCSYM